MRFASSTHLLLVSPLPTATIDSLFVMRMVEAQLKNVLLDRYTMLWPWFVNKVVLPSTYGRSFSNLVLSQSPASWTRISATTMANASISLAMNRVSSVSVRVNTQANIVKNVRVLELIFLEDEGIWMIDLNFADIQANKTNEDHHLGIDQKSNVSPSDFEKESTAEWVLKRSEMVSEHSSLLFQRFGCWR